MKLSRNAAAEAFRIGSAHHQAGDLEAAEAAYRQVLSALPGHAECLHLMGMLAYQTGRGELALGHLRRAAALRPSAAEYHNNLGGVLRDLGRPGEAIVAYRKALRLQPGVPDIHRNLGCALADAGQLAPAEDSFRAALRLNPFYVDAANDLGKVLAALGRQGEAQACFESAIRLRPSDPTLRNNLAVALRAQDRLDDAIASLRAAVRLRPDYANGWSNLGNLLQEQEQADAARECLERAVSLAPRSVDALINLGAALYRQRRLEEAATIFRRGLEIEPDSPDLLSNLSHAALALGDYDTGWPAYEARWRTRQLAGNWRDSGSPTWNGRDGIEGKTVLLFAEQGFGDTIQFVRFAPLLAERGARVLLLVQPALVSLIAGMGGIAKVHGFGEALPRVDMQYPLMSLPLVLGGRPESIKATVPYLAPGPEAASAWRERLAALPGLKVGIVWAGDPRPDQPEANRLDRRRSLRFAQLAPLAGIDGVSFVSLQKGAAAVQAKTPLAGLALHDWTGELNSFADTAALMQSLDLVISVDTSVAHLAGALARPVWLLNRFDSCWRWLDGRDDSPWYPGLRQFRQTSPGDWDGVLQRVRDALRRLAAQR